MSPVKVQQENLFDNVMLMILNEKAYTSGLIDEKTWIAVKREIQGKNHNME